MLSFGQASKLSMFDPLMGQIWKAEGKWDDGSKFMQEIRFEYALDSTIVIAKSLGYVDQAQTVIGQRSHGIRQYDKASNSVRFWEYDVFGGLTKGTVTSQGKNVLYRYHYGETLVTDLWEYVNDTTYNFIVGSYSNGLGIKCISVHNSKGYLRKNVTKNRANGKACRTIGFRI